MFFHLSALSSDVSPPPLSSALTFLHLCPQGQYAYLHQCIRDVLRARKLREQEHHLCPIYENVTYTSQRGE